MDKTTSILGPSTLLHAYRNGMFPMSMNEEGELGWFCPDPRGIIPLDDGFHIPHGLKRTLKKNPYEIRINTAFQAVMQGCAKRETTWISDLIIASYTRLHELGYAHSVESWKDGELVGGLYGVSIGGAFFGESMFSRATDASKVALVALVNRLRARNFLLLDTQWTTDHLKTMGAIDIRRRVYMTQLEAAIELGTSFLDHQEVESGIIRL